jgi:hypothetical protein
MFRFFSWCEDFPRPERHPGELSIPEHVESTAGALPGLFACTVQGGAGAASTSELPTVFNVVVRIDGDDGAEGLHDVVVLCPPGSWAWEALADCLKELGACAFGPRWPDKGTDCEAEEKPDAKVSDIWFSDTPAPLLPAWHVRLVTLSTRESGDALVEQDACGFGSRWLDKGKEREPEEKPDVILSDMRFSAGDVLQEPDACGFASRWLDKGKDREPEENPDVAGSDAPCSDTAVALLLGCHGCPVMQSCGKLGDAFEEHDA